MIRTALAGALLASPVLVLDDPRITESSGLIDDGRRVVTVNDSGADAVLYVVDQRSGATTTVEYPADPADVEALAPAGDGRVWVGDIGDNARSRSAVVVHRVGYRARAATRSYSLVYPDGPHDAEALARDPRGRLLVITKDLAGGGVYRAPDRLRAGTANRLRAIGTVGGWVTDAAMLPGGEHLLVRTYQDAAVYAYPSLDLVGRFPLPAQKQGETIAVSPSGRILAGSEGRRSRLLEVALPADLRAALEPAPASPPASAAAPRPEPPRPWPYLVPVAVGVLAVVVARRRRAR